MGRKKSTKFLFDNVKENVSLYYFYFFVCEQGLSWGDTWPEVKEKQETRDHKLLLIRNQILGNIKNNMLGNSKSQMLGNIKNQNLGNIRDQMLGNIRKEYHHELLGNILKKMLGSIVNEMI